MTARSVAAIASLALVCASGCTNLYEVPVETPIQAKLDVAPFRRVLVAGFIAGGTDDVDGNLETVRLLRSQLRSKTNLRVIEAEVLPLVELAGEQAAKAASGSDAAPIPPVVDPTAPPATGALPATPPTGGTEETKPAEPKAGKEQPLRSKKDVEKFERIFADAAFWKKLGEEYESPLIVTGTVMFTPHQRSGIVQREEEVYDSFGRRRVVPVRTYMERKGYILQPKFVFIDGRTGTVMHSENFREEVLYNANQSTPALSSYFELMDRLIPSFLSTLSSQKIKGTRVLLQ